MADIVQSVASKVAEYLVAPVGRHCGYVIFSDRFVHQLDGEVKKLDRARQRVQHSIDDAVNNMKQIEADVKDWVDEEKTVANKALGMLDDDGIAKKTCFYGWLPNPKARYRLGKEASRTVKEIQELILRGQFEKVDFKNPPPGLVGGVLNLSAGDGGKTITDSQASIFEGIMKALDDEKLKVIGAYGPGGVGKTTLLNEVEKKLKTEGRLFDVIVKVEVSQIIDLNDIRNQIADALSLEFKDKESSQGRRHDLSERMRSDPNEKFLIIFDNLWGGIDLEEVGIPHVSSKCKLLLSSRFKDVLEHKMHADRTFLLKGLKDDEAFKLFESTVGDKLRDNEELKAIANQVVKKLAGLPLMIISVASTLKYSDEHAWRNAQIEIDESNKEKTETIVKLSYDHLKSEDAKSLFLLCGLIGGTIRVELLLILGMGLGLFERFNKMIQDSRDRLNTTLDELHSACLLLDGGDDEDNVTIHDLYSEVVVSIPFGGHNSLMINSSYGPWPKEKPEKCWACLVNVGSDRLAELTRRGFPDLKILMLSKQHHEGDCNRLDFSYMKELRVLYFRSMNVTSLPNSIRIPENLQSLYLDNCNVDDVAFLGKLKALHILSFIGSTISRLPEEIGNLTNLRSLNLSKCRRLKIIKPGVLKGLINLEELHMQESFDRWMGKDVISSESCTTLAELNSLKKLTTLKISIPNPTILLEDGAVPFENLIRFWINIGNATGRTFKGLRTIELKLEECNSIPSREWVQKTLHKTQYLHLDKLRESKKNVHELCTQGFPQLKHLDIKNSPSINYIASSFDGLSLTAFTILESLILKNLINLEKICHGPIASQCFGKLKVVSVTDCDRLKYFWCLSHMQSLVQLEEIEVRGCGLMRAIVIDDAGKDLVAVDSRIELSNVRRLEFVALPNMISFCTGSGITSEDALIQAVVVGEEGRDEGTNDIIEQLPIRCCPLKKFFSYPREKKEPVSTNSDSQDAYSDSFFNQKISIPSLETLTLDSVGSFKRIWHDELPRSSFGKLATLTLSNCSDLLNVFPSAIMGRLHNLKKVKVSFCPSLKSLFGSRSLGSRMEQTRVLLPELVSVYIDRCDSLESLFDCGFLDSNTEQTGVLVPKLEEVRVSGAGRLRHVVKSDSQTFVGFPHLKKVFVYDCSELRYLFPNYTATTLGKLESLWIGKCEQMKEVVPKKGGRLREDVMHFPSLTHLSIWIGHNFEAFIPSTPSVKRTLGETTEEDDESSQSLFNEMATFHNIRKLEICGAQCKKLWNNQIPTNSFCKLESLELECCNNLQRIAPSHMWKRLQHCLEFLEVRSCHSIEFIRESDGTDIWSGKLRCLDVCNLKNLRHIWQFDGPPDVLFPNLRSIKVLSCPRLTVLFPIFTAKFLGQIETLWVRYCESMELIACYGECAEGTGMTITFSKLTELILVNLPKFRRYLPEKYSTEFPFVLKRHVDSCGTEPNTRRRP